MSKQDVHDKEKKIIERVKEQGDFTEHNINLAKKTTFVDSFSRDYWRTSGVFLQAKSNDMRRELGYLKEKKKKGKDKTGLRGLYEAITNNKKGRQWIDDFFSIGNAATQTRIVCGMPDGFSQTGKAIKLGPTNFKQDWNGYGSIRGKGNVKLDLQPFSYDNFINCRKRQCWLCGMPLYWDSTMKPEGEHILQYPMMTCFGAGPVTKLFLVEQKYDGSKGLEEGSILSGFYSDVSSLIGESRGHKFVDWKRRVRTFSYAWSHSHCNRIKQDKSFIKMGMTDNEEIFYYINYKAVNWFAETISDSINTKIPVIGGDVGRGWEEVLRGLYQSKKDQGTKVRDKANAIGFDSIYENIMKQLIPLNLLLNQGFGSGFDSSDSPKGINLNDPQNKIRANIYFNYRRLRVYFRQHMEQFLPAGSKKEKKASKNKNLLMDFFTTILTGNPNSIHKQRALLNHCFNYESDFSSGSSRGGGVVEDAIKMSSSRDVNPYDFTATYTYLPLADLLNEMTNYKETEHDEEGVQYIMDVADETKGFDDSMNFNHLLKQIEPSDYDKDYGSIVELIHGVYQTHEGEFKKHSDLAMNNFIRNMLMKMKFDKYGELLDYISENKGKNPNFKRGIRNNYPEAEHLEELVSDIKEEHKSLKKILFDGRINKKDFDEWLALNNTVKAAPYIYDIDGEVKKFVESDLITVDEGNELYFDYFIDDIVEINDGARWERWQINLTNYIQHRTPTGEIKTFDYGDLAGEEYKVKKYDFGPTYRNNLKIIQYAGLLPRMDNTSPRQKKLIAEKIKERRQIRRKKMLDNIGKGLPAQTGIKLKEGDGIPKNFSAPKVLGRGEIHGNRGTLVDRAFSNLNSATFRAMGDDEKTAVTTLPELKRAQSLTSSPLLGSPQTNLEGTPEQVRRRLEGKSTISRKRSRSLDSYVDKKDREKEEKKKKTAQTAQRRIAWTQQKDGDKMDTSGGKKKKRTKKRRRKKKKTRKSKRKKKRTKKKKRRRKKKTRRRR